MNVNLAQAISRDSLHSHPLGNGESIELSIMLSAAVLAGHADTCPVGPPALIPERDQESYPGSYQVWFPVVTDDQPQGFWVYVDPDGVVHGRGLLPTPTEMIERGEGTA